MIRPPLALAPSASLPRRTVRDLQRVHRDSARPPAEDGSSIGIDTPGFSGTF
jgi:hypothetical protein